MNKERNKNLWKFFVRSIVLSAVGILTLPWFILKYLFWNGDNSRKQK